MRCSRTRRWLSAFLDGELAPRRQSALEDHLARCPSCSAELASARERRTLLGEAGAVPSLPPELWGRILTSLDAAERRSWFGLRRPQLVRTACVAVCALVGLAGGAFIAWPGDPGHSGRPSVSCSERKLVAEAFDEPAFGLTPEMEGLRCVRR